MFSSGNLAERMGIADRVRPGAVVVDLFAGIGYFSLPIAVRSRAKRVYACELNPVSFRYLVENTRLNRTTNLIPLLGDCRDVEPRVLDRKSTRLNSSHSQISYAVFCLKKKKNIHYSI